MFKLFINFKTYPQGSGEKAVALAKICEQVSLKTKIQIIPIVQTADIFRVKQAVKLPIWAQHLDFQPQGAFTGWQNLETIIAAGAAGTLLNHSEHSIPPGMIKQLFSQIKKEKNFETILCCKTLGQMERLVKLRPDYLAYEISELIGGKVSITQAAPKQIKHALEICGSTPLVVGAGVHEAGDLKTAQELGTRGVLLASAIVLAQDPEKELLSLLSLLKED